MSFDPTPNGTYGAKMPMPPRPMRGLFLGVLNIILKLQGARILTLTTIGSKSGKEHSMPLAWFPDGDQAWLIVASAAGQPKHPQWYFNIARNPDKVWIDTGSGRRRVVAAPVTGEAYDEAWNRIVSVAKTYIGYKSKTDRVIPIIRLTAA